MTPRAFLAALLAVATLSPLAAGTAGAAGDGAQPPERAWSWHGLFGTYDRAQLQRGLEIYTGQCVNCHSLKYIRFRDLVEIGLSPDAAKALAATWQVPGEPDEWGDPTLKPAELHHAFPPPYRNDAEARAANNGALPPDLSLMAKARAHGADYIAALLADPAYNAGQPDRDGLYPSAYFAAGNIAMAPPLYPGLLLDAEGNEASTASMAEDIAAFLAWAAEPKLEERKRLGLKVVLFLLVGTGLLYVCKRKIWAKVEH